MEEHARGANLADGLQSDALCARKRQPPCAVRCDRRARATRTRNVLRPMDRARNPVVAGKRRARNELQSREKLLPNPGEFHDARDVNATYALRVDTSLKGPLYYGNEVCRCSFRFELSNSFRSRQGRSGRTEGGRKSDPATRRAGQRLRISQDETLLLK